MEMLSSKVASNRLFKDKSVEVVVETIVDNSEETKTVTRILFDVR